MTPNKKTGLKQTLSPTQIAALKGEPQTETPMDSPVVPVVEKPSTTLSPEEQALIMQAKAAQSKMNALGTVQSNIHNPSQMPPPDDTFLEINGLPSGGAFYMNQMYGQPLRVQDLLLIQSMDSHNIINRFDQIFKRRLWGINPGDVLLVDELFLALWLRATSFEGYNFPAMPFACTACGYEAKSDEAEFNWGDISWDVDELEITKALHEEKGYHGIVLPKSKKEVKIFLRQRKHLSAVQAIVKKDFWDYGKEPSNEYYELLLMATILDIGATDIKQTAAYIQELSAMDFVFLIKEINKASLDAEAVVNTKCPACQEVNPVMGYPFRPDIYLPTDS